MNFSVTDFANAACLASHPCDLGTRCTVFMNSKVKQVLREGYTIGDIAAGLSYSVIKNCLYKVLKLKNTEELGTDIVLQGGTMKNDSVVRTFELLTGVSVHRSNISEIMGAYGCALYAKAKSSGIVALENIIKAANYATQSLQCSGCENNCYINKYSFANGNTYFSGNKCEKIFSNRGDDATNGENIYSDKYNYLFNRKNTQTSGKTIGLPRCLNMYENYPFWHKLFDACGLQVCLSDPSTFKNYEDGIHSIMASAANITCGKKVRPAPKSSPIRFIPLTKASAVISRGEWPSAKACKVKCAALSFSPPITAPARAPKTSSSVTAAAGIVFAAT